MTQRKAHENKAAHGGDEKQLEFSFPTEQHLQRRGSPVNPAVFEPDDFMTLPIASRLPELRVNGRPLNPSQLYRYCADGVNGVKLRTVRLGRRRVTTRRWVREFTDSVTASYVTTSDPQRQADDAASRPSETRRSKWLHKR